MDKNSDIDNIDLKIISLLNEDAKTPYTEIAKKSLCLIRDGSRQDEKARGYGDCEKCHFKYKLHQTWI